MQGGANAGGPYAPHSRHSSPEGLRQTYQEQQEHPQHLLSPQQSNQSDLIGACWPAAEHAGASISPSYQNMNSQAASSPGRGMPQQQHHWGHNSAASSQHQHQQQQQHASCGYERPRSSSPAHRRLANAMVAEAKAAAAAVLRSPPGSSAASRMLAAEADEQERQQRWRGSRTPERMPNNSSRSPRHDSLVPICAGVVGTPLSARSTTVTDSLASSQEFASGSMAAAAADGLGAAGRMASLRHLTNSLSPQSSADWTTPQSSSAAANADAAMHFAPFSSNGRLQQLGLKQSFAGVCTSHHQHSHSDGWQLELPVVSPEAAAAVTAAFGDMRPAESCDGLHMGEAHQQARSAQSSECFTAGGHSLRGSSGGPVRELSFAAVGSPPGVTHGGSCSSAGGASVEDLSTAAGAAAAAAQEFSMQPPAVAGFAATGLHVNSSPNSNKKGRLFKCCFLQTNSATASGAGAPESHPTAQTGFSRFGGGSGPASPSGHSELACAGMVADHQHEAIAASSLSVGEHAHDSGARCCMGDETSFCSAESVAATSWTGSCAGTEKDLAGVSSSDDCGGSSSEKQAFPLQAVPPPPLWASPLFPPPQGYVPVGVEEEQQSQHPHFAQRVKTLRLQAAAAAAAVDDSAAAGQIGGNCAEHDACSQEQQYGQQEGCADEVVEHAEVKAASLGPAAIKPSYLAGLRVNVGGKDRKGGRVFSVDSPTAPGDDDRIKAFFQEPSHPLQHYQQTPLVAMHVGTAAAGPSDAAVGPAAHPLTLTVPNHPLTLTVPTHPLTLSESVSETALFSNNSYASAGYRRSMSANGKQPGGSEAGQLGVALAAGGSKDSVGQGDSSGMLRRSRIVGDAAAVEYNRKHLATEVSSPQSHSGASSPSYRSRVTAVPGSSLYSRKGGNSTGSSPRFAPAKLPPSPRRVAAAQQHQPPPAATAAAALAKAKAEAADEAAVRAQTAAEAASADAQEAAARAAAARVFKASAAAAVAAMEEDAAANADAADSTGSSSACPSREASFAAAEAQTAEDAARAAAKPSAKAALKQAKKAAYAAAEASAAAVAAEAKAVEAATAAVVAAVVEERSSRPNSRAASPPRVPPAEAVPVAVATTAAAAVPPSPKAIEAAASLAAKVQAAAMLMAKMKAAAAGGAGYSSASPSAAAAAASDGVSAAAAVDGNSAGIDLTGAPCATTATQTSLGGSAAAAESADKDGQEATAAAGTDSLRDKARTQAHSSSSCSSPASSPRRLQLLSTRSSTASSAGSKTPKSYAAMSAAKLATLKSSGSTSPTVASRQAAASNPGLSIKLPNSSSTSGTTPRSATAAKSGTVLLGSPGRAAASTTGATTASGNVPGLQDVAGGSSSSSSSGNKQALLQSCPASITVNLVKTAAAEADRSSSSSSGSSACSIGTKLRVGSNSTFPLDLDRMDSVLSKQESVPQPTTSAAVAEQSVNGSQQQQASGGSDSNAGCVSQGASSSPAATTESTAAGGAALPPSASPRERALASPRERALASPRERAAANMADLPIEERLMLKQQQLMQILTLLRGMRSRSPSPGRGGPNSRSASPGRGNSRGPSPSPTTTTTTARSTTAAHVGVVSSMTRSSTISPPRERSRTVSPRRAASPEALERLAVPAYRQQSSSRTASPEPSAPSLEIASATASQILKSLRSRTPERAGRPGLDSSGAKTDSSCVGRNAGSPGKQRDHKSPLRSSGAPLPRVATLLHAADAATSASAAVRAATPQRNLSPGRGPPARGVHSTSSAAAAGRKGAYAADRLSLRNHGPPVPASGAAGGSKQLTTTGRSITAAMAAAAAGRLQSSPTRSRHVDSSSRVIRDDKHAAKVERAAKVVRTLIALDDLLPGTAAGSANEQSSNSSSTANAANAAATAAVAAEKHASISQLRAAAETLLKNLQAGQPVPQDALMTILMGAEKLSGATKAGKEASAASAAVAAGTCTASGATVAAKTAARAAAEPQSSAPAAAAADGGLNALNSSAKLHALAQQLAVLCQDMGTNVNLQRLHNNSSSNNSSSNGQTNNKSSCNGSGPANAANKEGSKNSLAAAAATAAYTAAAAAAAAMDAASNKQARKQQKQQRQQQQQQAESQQRAQQASRTPAAEITPCPETSTNTSNSASAQPRPAVAASPQRLADPAAVAASAATALAAANAAAAAAKAQLHRPSTPRRRQPLAKKLLRMMASGRKSYLANINCHRLPSVAGSSSGGGAGGCAGGSPRALTASAAASLPRSPLGGVCPLAARKASNVLKPKGWVEKHSSFRLLTPWLSFRGPVGAAAAPSAMFYTQAFRASVGGPAEVPKASAAAANSQSKVGPGSPLSPGYLPSPLVTGTQPPQQQQQQQSVSAPGAGKQAAASTGGRAAGHLASSSEALRRLFGTSSSGTGMPSLKSSSKSYYRTGEFNAEAADEETAGTAAPAISAADHNHVRHILSDAAGASTQLGSVPEGDNEGTVTGSSCGMGSGAADAGGAGDGMVELAETGGAGGNNARMLMGCRMAKAPPMMSRSAYLQYLKQQSQMRRLKAQQGMQTAPSSAGFNAAGGSNTAAAAAASSRRNSRADPTSQALSVLQDPATTKVADAISSILMIATAEQQPLPEGPAAADSSAADGLTAAAAKPTAGSLSSSSAAAAAHSKPAGATAGGGIISWGSGLGFAGDPHWRDVAAAAEAADAVLASSKEHAANEAARAASSPAGAVAGVNGSAASSAGGAGGRLTEQSAKSAASYGTTSSEQSSNSGAAAAAAAAAAVAAVSAAAAAAEAKAAAAAANTLMGNLLLAEQVDAAFADRAAPPKCHHQQLNYNSAALQQQQHQQHLRELHIGTSMSSPYKQCSLPGSTGASCAYEYEPSSHSRRTLQQQHQQQLSQAGAWEAAQPQLQQQPMQQSNHWQGLQHLELEPEESTDSALLPKDKRQLKVCPRPSARATGCSESVVSRGGGTVGSAAATDAGLLRQQLLEEQQQALWEEEQQRLKQQLLIEEQSRLLEAEEGKLRAEKEQLLLKRSAAAAVQLPHRQHSSQQHHAGFSWDSNDEAYLLRQQLAEQQRQQLQLQEQQQRMLEEQLQERRAMLLHFDKEQQQLLRHYQMQQQLWEEHCRMQQQRYLQEQEAEWADECRKQRSRRRSRASHHRRRCSMAASDATSTVAISDGYTDQSLEDHPAWTVGAVGASGAGGQHHQQQHSRSTYGKSPLGTPASRNNFSAGHL